MKFFSFWRSLASFRVRIALNLKNVPAEVIFVDLDANAHRDPEYRKINPQMALPALVEDDGTTLFQSLAILEYLDEKYPSPPLLPADINGRARVRALALMVACEGHPLLTPRVRRYLDHELNLRDTQQAAWRRHWIVETLAALEGHLAENKDTGKFCHGDAADAGGHLHGRPCHRRDHAADRSENLSDGEAHLRDRDGAAGICKGASAGAAGYAGGDAEEGVARPISVIASEAKQSTSRHEERMDCFASLAMTGGDICDKIPRSRGALRPSFAEKVLSLKMRGSRECRVPASTRGLVCNVEIEAHTSIQVQPEQPGIPCAMALRLMPRSPWRRIRLASIAGGLKIRRSPVGPCQNLRRLDTSHGCQDHTVLPYASAPYVLRAVSRSRDNPPCDHISRPTPSRPPLPAPTFVTMANAPLGGTGWREL